ncbi:hypothetical protein K1W54_06760 [Micromonospora sp. CPCC 205371]|nr:hypothetical protein [Micromonospora sp. CPCC 205371]
MRSAVGALMLLVGVPIVLVQLVGWPWPTRWPDRQQWQQWLEEPFAGNLLIGAVSIVAWLLWAVLVYAAVAHLILRLRRAVRWLARLPRLPLPTPMQGLAGGMLGAVAVTTTSGAVSDTPPAAITATSTLDNKAGVQQGAADAGVTVPDGGWLPTPVAEAVNAAAALVWWRRRRLYLPRPLAAVQRLDGDLAPLPQAARVVQAALADAGHPAGLGDLPLVNDLPPGGVGWTGPGAAAAARGTLIALLLGHRPVDRPRVVTTADDLRTLLGADAGAGDGGPGLGGGGGGAGGVGVPAPVAGGHPRQPVTILTTPPADGRLSRRLAALLLLGAGHHVTGVLLGSWPHATTWHIQSDGTTSAAGRLCTLSGTAAADLLRLAALRSDETPTQPRPVPVVPAAADRPGAPIRLRLLGGVGVTVNGQPVPISRTAAVQILTFLALHPAGATTAQLTAAVWPHLRPHAAAGGFHTTISHLRKILREATGGREVITRTGEQYVLDHTAVHTDVGQLLAAAGQAVTAPSPAERDTALRGLIDLYRGELAAGHDWQWLAPLREAVRRQVIDAYTTLATDHPEQAAQLWQAAAHTAPGNQHLHRQAVAALTAAGQHRAVAALREQHTRTLAAAGLQHAADQGL